MSMSINDDFDDTLKSDSDDTSEEEVEESSGRRFNPRILLVALVALVLICLVGVLLYNVFTTGGEEVAGGPPSPTTAPTEEPTLTPAPTEEATPTPTRVITEPAAKPTVEPTPKSKATVTHTPTPTPAPTATPTRQPTSPADQGAALTLPQPQAAPIENLLKNSDFEQGFDQRGVALNWQPFGNDSVQILYGQDTLPYIDSGSSAQRITLVGATQPNRYGGIYQQVEVVPGQVYTLSLKGQPRSVVGDIAKSSYGYRMQYALNQTGEKNWQRLAEADWVELPWDELPLYVGQTPFYSYTTTVTPISNTLTLFVRGWNKWPDQSEAQYTLDSFSLVGPTVVTQPVFLTGVSPTPGEQMIDKPLPITGEGDEIGFWSDGRFWGGLLILLLLAMGAVYRARWGY
jgi:hypothetical protein